jgi:hypothetical protein
MSDAIYRPGSGTEGMDFIASWCARCRGDLNEDCPILAATFAYNAADPNYPADWRMERGEPVCASFEALDPLDQPIMRAAAVRDLFAGYPRRPSQGEQIRMLVRAEFAA